MMDHKYLSNKNKKLTVFTLTPNFFATIFRNVLGKPRYLPDYKKRVFYTCGPPAMVQAMINLLEKIKVDENRIMKETFPGY